MLKTCAMIIVALGFSVCLSAQSKPHQGSVTPLMGIGTMSYPEYDIYCDPTDWYPDEGYCGCDPTICDAEPVPTTVPFQDAQCEAQAYYRPLTGIAGLTNAKHIFWIILLPTEWTDVLDAGPTGTCLPACGWLNAHVKQGFTGYLSADNPTKATLFYNTGLGDVPQCSEVVKMGTYTFDWPQNTVYYNPFTTNSNTFAHRVATAGGITDVTIPEGVSVPGW